MDRREATKRARELRRQQTPAESILWRRLRGKQMEGLKFRRQHILGPFIVDFVNLEHKLIIEIDGGAAQPGREPPAGCKPDGLAGGRGVPRDALLE